VVASAEVNLLHYDQARGRSFYRTLLERVQSIPAVESASLACFVPLSGQGDSVDVFTEEDAASGRSPVPVGYNIVTAQYFQTLRIPVLQGRGFREDGTDSSAEVVIDEAMARRFWPGKIASEVLGRRISISGRRGPFFEIVGIVPSAKHSSLTEELRPFAYLPFSNQYRSEMTLHARIRREFAYARNTTLLTAGIRTEVRAIDKDLPLSGVGPMIDRMSFALVPIHIAGTILAIAGILALTLAAVGVYGVASFTAVHRTREVGIRLALGAEPPAAQLASEDNCAPGDSLFCPQPPGSISPLLANRRPFSADVRERHPCGGVQ
jgi:putative ABC transport system permease protein